MCALLKNRPLRVIALADKFKLTPGLSRDLIKSDSKYGKPRDFSNPEKRARAVKLVKDDKPVLIIGSPAVHIFRCTIL